MPFDCRLIRTEIAENILTVKAYTHFYVRKEYSLERENGIPNIQQTIRVEYLLSIKHFSQSFWLSKLSREKKTIDRFLNFKETSHKTKMCAPAVVKKKLKTIKNIQYITHITVSSPYVGYATCT